MAKTLRAKQCHLCYAGIMKSLSRICRIILFAGAFAARSLSAQEVPMGYVVLPAPKPRPVYMSGDSHVGLALGGRDDSQSGSDGSREKPPEFDVFDFPDEKSERIVSVTTVGAMRILRASTTFDADNVNLLGNDEGDRKPKLKLWVFERQKEWARVRFLMQMPWNGRDGWIRISSTKGTFVEAD